MTTDCDVIVRNTPKSRAIVCLQRKAAKVIPTEEDIVVANKLAFNDDIGTITNFVTSMFEVQSGFSKNSKEYKILEYRTMCGQNYQQNGRTFSFTEMCSQNNLSNCWNTVKLMLLQHKDETPKCECGESRKNA